MKYKSQEDFETVNMFGRGEPNVAYAEFFKGESYLNPLTDFN